MLSKNIFVIVAFFVLVIINIGQLYQLGKILPTKKAEVADSFSQFRFERLNGSMFSRADIPLNDQPTVLMYMDPTCQDCLEMTQKILRNFKEFENVNLFFVTEADKDQLQKFWLKFELDKFPNIYPLLDRNMIMYNTFQLYSVPAFVIYDSEFRQIKVIDDHFNLSIVLKYVREASKKNNSTVF